MKQFALLAAAALLTGCADVEDTAVDGYGTSVNAAATELAVDIDAAPIPVSFKAGDSAVLEVPEMHCPFGCFPSVKDALEGVDGIAAVDLVKQQDPNKINDRRVVISFNGSVDGRAAVAALDDAQFPGASFDASKSSSN